MILHDSIFQLPPIDDDDELTFAEVADSDNPLSAPLVSALRLLRRRGQSLERYRVTLKAAIELLHTQEHDITRLRARNLQLIAELRTLRRDQAA